MTLTTKDFGALAGVVEEAPVDPLAPVEKPRRCGLCAHFRRFFAGSTPRVVRFGTCTKIAPGNLGHDVAPTDAIIGGLDVGDEFGCVHFEARR